LNGIHIRPAILADAPDIAQVHVQAWHETFRGVVPNEMLAALSVTYNTHMWHEILRASDTTVVVAQRTGSAHATTTSSATAPAVSTSAPDTVVADPLTIVGFGSAGPARERNLGADGEITALYLVHAVKRCGLGRALFSHLIEALAKRGHRSVGAWVLCDNGQARHFYEAMGGQRRITREIAHSAAMLEEVAYVWPDLARIIGR
jgi:ribosomal protein S18 acetylase RimI-like enzyme